MSAVTMTVHDTKADYRNADERWQAVIDRNPDADGCFVYAVKTTGVYCRPSCASRRAKRENVEFFDVNADAEKGGYRPCKRCRPNEMSTHQKNRLAIEKACRIIEAAETAPSLDEMAAEVELSPFHFHRLFKKETGVTPKAYAKAHRAKRFQQELHSGESVTGAIYASGYQSPSRVYADAEQTLGMAPRAFKSGGKGETIRYGFGDTWLGTVLVAATERGICAIQIGDGEDALLFTLKSRFTKADIAPGGASFNAWLQAALTLIEEGEAGCDLPLDIQGTAFQLKVWTALKAIPLGETATYSEIAERIGEPRAVRAVANACGANPAAIAIPCHRVVRSDGGSGGYRWGTEKKTKLLERESAKGAK